MPAIDVVDSSWIGAAPAAVAAAVADPANWPRWWPGLELRLDEDRGGKGVRWTVPRVAADVPRARVTGLSGSAEVWLQPLHDGVVAHFFLRLDPPAGATLPDRHRDRVRRHYRRLAKRAFWTLGDRLDRDRAARLAGAPRPADVPVDDAGWQISW